MGLIALLKRLYYKPKLARQLSTHKFDNFEIITKDKKENYIFDKESQTIKEVGGEQELFYPTFHDALPHVVLRQMTILKYDRLMDVNAVYINQDRWERIDEVTGKIYFQPLRIEAKQS